IQGKVVVITGATSGIGQVAAERLASMGARIVLVARDQARGQVALARLRACSPRDAHRIHFADLSRLAEMKRVGTEIASAESRVDVLINNAGALFSSRRVTDDGLERTFATNHVAYFVLTHYLRERLIASAIRAGACSPTACASRNGCSPSPLRREQTRSSTWPPLPSWPPRAAAISTSAVRRRHRRKPWMTLRPIGCGPKRRN